VAGQSAGQGRKEVFTAYLFLLPFLAVYAAFLVYPFFNGVWISLHDWNLLEVAINPGRPGVRRVEKLRPPVLGPRACSGRRSGGRSCKWLCAWRHLAGAVCRLALEPPHRMATAAVADWRCNRAGVLVRCSAGRRARMGAGSTAASGRRSETRSCSSS
jgi:hypothetical protein